MIGGVIVTVPRAVPLIGAPPGNHLNLRTTGGVKVIRLTKGADLEFLNTLNRGSHYTRSHRAGLGASETGEVLDVPNGISSHIIGVVAAIDGESVLVHVAAGNITSGRYAWLQTEQRGCITTEIRQQLKLL